MPHALLVPLVPHPGTPCAALDACTVELTPDTTGGLRLRYRLTGCLAGLRLPAAAVPERRDGLWQHTCCEVFIGVPGDPGYREFNFSPSGDWAAYVFAGPRLRLADPILAAPVIEVTHTESNLDLVATLPAAALPAAPRLELGLAAVIEPAAGALAYWALRHAAPHPDFHRRETFALSLSLERCA